MLRSGMSTQPAATGERSLARFDRLAFFARRVVSQTVSGLLVLLIAAATLALVSRVSDVVTGGALIRLLGGVAASDVDELIRDRRHESDPTSPQAVTIVTATSLDASPDAPHEEAVCIGPGHYFLTVRGIQAADGRYLGRARLTRDPPGALVDLRVNPEAPVSLGFLTASEAACYRLLATAPARLYWLLDW